MTDERPAEPDTSGVLRLVAEYARARGCVISWTAENERRAVEVAARTLAIEYAESRVRAIYETATGLPVKPTLELVIAELAALARLKGKLS